MRNTPSGWDFSPRPLLCFVTHNFFATFATAEITAKNVEIMRFRNIKEVLLETIISPVSLKVLIGPCAVVKQERAVHPT